MKMREQPFKTEENAGKDEQWKRTEARENQDICIHNS
jgi:hypothetical protein